MSEPNEEAPRPAGLNRRPSRDEILYDYFLENAREILDALESAKSVTTDQLDTLRKLLAEGRSIENAIKQSGTMVERSVSKLDERIASRFSGFESSLVSWAGSFRRSSVLLVFVTAFIAGVAGTIVGGMILVHLR